MHVRGHGPAWPAPPAWRITGACSCLADGWLPLSFSCSRSSRAAGKTLRRLRRPPPTQRHLAVRCLLAIRCLAPYRRQRPPRQRRSSPRPRSRHTPCSGARPSARWIPMGCRSRPARRRPSSSTTRSRGPSSLRDSCRRRSSGTTTATQTRGSSASSETARPFSTRRASCRDRPPERRGRSARHRSHESTLPTDALPGVRPVLDPHPRHLGRAPADRARRPRPGSLRRVWPR